MTTITEGGGEPQVPGWFHKSVDYDNIDGWRKIESRDTAWCKAGPDSFDRARAMLEGRAPFPVYRQVTSSSTWFYDAAALLHRYGLELIPPPEAAPCPP